LRTGCLRGIFGPKREEVAGGWRKLHEELHNLYASPDIIRVIKSRRMRLVEAYSTHGRDEQYISNFGGKPERATPRGRQHRWGDIGLELRGTG
jgi:hypothetical protein